MSLRHFRSELPYSDLRRFKVPSESGPAADCSLVGRYLSNSHLFHLQTPYSDSRFAIKLLAAFANRNVSVETLLMSSCGGGLLDYRSMNVVFDGGMRLATLELHMFEHELATLVKTTDFFRSPTVRKLKELKLHLVRAP